MEDVTKRFNRPHDTLNLRRANALHGLPMGENGEEGFYAQTGRVLGSGCAGPAHEVTDILVSDDGLGPSGFYTRVTVWSDEILLAECPLHNLEGVIYV